MVGAGFLEKATMQTILDWSPIIFAGLLSAAAVLMVGRLLGM
jgi:hypothetical protein